MIVTKKALTLLTLTLAAAGAYATDYYVAMTGNDGNDGSSEAPFATIDTAISAATEASDVIYVAPGTYATTTANGPTLKANLVGTGATRADVVIRAGNLSDSNYRTLKMESGSLATNITFIGNTASKVATGGTIYMVGGTLVDCVVRDGTAKNGSAHLEGGNLYLKEADALVINCEIYGGHATKRGANVYIDNGTVRDCIIRDGVSDNIGGNVYIYKGTLSGCTISGGTSTNNGGNLFVHDGTSPSPLVSRCTITGGRAGGDGGNVKMQGGSGVMEDCIISNGTNTAASGDKKGANVHMDNAQKMSRCHLYGGVNAAYEGGSLYIGSPSAVVEDCLIDGSECGGVLLNGSCYLYSCTIVNNDKYGVWAWNTSQHVFNSVIYGNTNSGSNNDWKGNEQTGASAEFLNNALTESGSRFSPSSFPTVVLLADASAFADYANGDYHPAAGSSLIDAGGDDPRSIAASATDLDGNPRLSGKIDIGCYEFQKADLVVRIDNIDNLNYVPVYAPSVVTFEHSAENSASPDDLVFTYDFGDGTEEITRAGSISHTYMTPGIYNVTIVATNDCEEESATMTYNGYVRVASSSICVTPGNGAGTFPYDTAETGYGSLVAAIEAAQDGYTILLGPGVHETSDQIAFTKAIAIRGTGAAPEATIVRNTSLTADSWHHRTMEVNNAAGRVENITIEGGRVSGYSGDQFGGNLNLRAGVVSNCVIRGGIIAPDGRNGAGAGVAVGDGAVLTHCVITNNVVQGTSSSGNYAGGAVYVAYGAKNARVSNCLIAYNRYVTSGDAKAGSAGIRFGGSNDNTAIENCTIVSNVVEGSLSDDSAGLHCTTWHGKLRNNIIVGNYETDKGRCTSVRLGFDSGSNFIYRNNITDDAQIADSGNKSKGNFLVGSPALLFVNYAAGDFSLSPAGGAYNRGTVSGLALLPEVDLAGNPRLSGRTIDIGCYECQSSPGFSILVK